MKGRIKQPGENKQKHTKKTRKQRNKLKHMIYSRLFEKAGGLHENPLRIAFVLFCLFLCVFLFCFVLSCLFFVLFVVSSTFCFLFSLLF